MELTKGKEFVLWSVYCLLMNKRSDIMRSTLGVGPSRKMYRNLARRLVDECRIYCISLFSGMQEPIFDAVKYLADIRDYESIPRLKQLFENYTTGPKDRNRTFQWQGFSITSISGPMDRLHAALQWQTTITLLTLLPNGEAIEFVRGVFRDVPLRYLGIDTIIRLVDFSIKTSLNDLADFFLDQGKKMKARFDRESDDWNSNRMSDHTRCFSYNDLYNYEELVYGAYMLVSKQSVKEEALQILIGEYNHPDTGWTFSKRTHCGISHLLLKLIVRDLSGNPEEQNRIISALNPERYKQDLESYLKIGNHRI